MTGVRARRTLAAVPLAGPRLELEPLRVGHADELVTVLADERLHAFTGGSPATLAQLRDRYAVQVGGSPDPAERWLNWILRRRADGRAAGYVQATVTIGPAPTFTGSADVAWVVGVPFQGQGYAGEAAVAMVDWLRGAGIDQIVAFVHPQHQASAAVARRIGLVATADLVDGELRWTDRAVGT